MKNRSSILLKIRKTFIENIAVLSGIMILLVVLMAGLMWEIFVTGRETTYLVKQVAMAREYNLLTQNCMYKRCLTSEEGDQKNLMSEADSYEVEFQRNLKNITDNREEYSDDYVKIQAIIDETFPVKNQAILMSGAGKNTEVITYLKENYFPKMDKIDHMLKQISANLDEQTALRLRYYSIGGAIIMIVILVLLTFCLQMAWRRARAASEGICKPIEQLNILLSKVAQGDLYYRTTYKSDDEFGDLIANVRETQDELRKYIQDIDRVLSEISRGNLDVDLDVEYKGAFGHIKICMSRILIGFSEMLGTIQDTSLLVKQNANEFTGVAAELEMSSQAQQNFAKNLGLMTTKLKELLSDDEEIQFFEEIVARINDLAADNSETAKKVMESGEKLSRRAEELDMRLHDFRLMKEE